MLCARPTMLIIRHYFYNISRQVAGDFRHRKLMRSHVEIMQFDRHAVADALHVSGRLS